MAPKPTAEPSYNEALVLLAIDEQGTSKVDLIARLGGRVSAGDLPKYVERLAQKGLVRLGGYQRRIHAPASRIVVLTECGNRVRRQLSQKGVR